MAQTLYAPKPLWASGSYPAFAGYNAAFGRIFGIYTKALRRRHTADGKDCGPRDSAGVGPT